MSASAPSHAHATRLDLLVVGHTNVDHILGVRHLPIPDRTLPVDSWDTRLGGTAANIARAAAGTGLRVGLVSRVGTDFPPDLLHQLRRDKVDVEGVEVVPGEHGPTCYILEDPRGHQVTIFRQGPMDDSKGSDVPTQLIRSSPWVHVTTGDPEFQLKVVWEAQAGGSRVAADPAQEIHYRWDKHRLSSLLSGAEILFGNRSEILQAKKLLGLPRVESLTSIVPLLVMTDGARGAVAYSRGGRERVAAVRSSGPYRVTGAGDAFRGGFYSGWLGGLPLRECLRKANQTAARWMREPAPVTGLHRGGHR